MDIRKETFLEKMKKEAEQGIEEIRKDLEQRSEELEETIGKGLTIQMEKLKEKGKTKSDTYRQLKRPPAM